MLLGAAPGRAGPYRLAAGRPGVAPPPTSPPAAPAALPAGPAELPKLAQLADALTRRLAAPAPLPEAEDAEDGLGDLMGQVRRVAAQETTLLFTGEPP